MTGAGSKRVVILGDIGGQFDAFEKVLRELGIDPSDPVLPDGMTLIQVGDILRVGGAFPELDNSECVALADALIRVNPHRYIQLVGNHEVAVLGGRGNYLWGEQAELDPIVGDWWARGLMKVAAVIRHRDRQILVTHAGLTIGLWKSLGAPTAVGAARLLNQHVTGDINNLIMPGQLINGVPSLSADPVNALAGTELLPGWLAYGSPGFDQIHGHSTAWAWQDDGWYGNPLEQIRQNSIVDHATRRYCTLIDASANASESTITCVDWKYLIDHDTRTWPLLSFEDAAVIA
ncbi:hypothetical protein [Aeromicrobium sp. 179-A 4D2 NHS]|uniref:hypothetical protein n=1 Tax=Aeromicrobium sp. 179-A 4D2 NHS TaxID=3142375 RepID=UPI0039A027FA